MSLMMTIRLKKKMTIVRRGKGQGKEEEGRAGRRKSRGQPQQVVHSEDDGDDDDTDEHDDDHDDEVHGNNDVVVSQVSRMVR